jgi:hypothetical protein
MKLLMTWLLGVPALVLAMVLARAMSPQGMQVAEAATLSSCPGQLDLHHVGTTVVKQGHRAACNTHAVQ